MNLLEVKDLRVSVEDKEIIKGLNLSIKPGEVHAIMGRNGSGKSSLANALMGHPKFRLTSGSVLFKGKDISGLAPDERAKKRIFLGFQHPVEIPGVTVANFLRTVIRSVRKDEIPTREVRKRIKKELEVLKIPEAFMTRFLNEGFSGGEKKKLETLQLRLLEPELSILDETDSGLDIDALKTIAAGIVDLRNENRSFLLITHYQRLLGLIQPDVVHVLLNGRIVKTGGPELAKELEARGYDWIEAA